MPRQRHELGVHQLRYASALMSALGQLEHTVLAPSGVLFSRSLNTYYLDLRACSARTAGVKLRVARHCKVKDRCSFHQESNGIVPV